MYVQQIKDERFKVLAYTDALTGLKNRASFEEEMDTLRNEQNRNAKAYIVIVDINNLKWINDNLGHKFGDKAITTVAGCIEDIFLNCSSCYRIGGDEFCIIIHKISQIKVNYMLDKLAHNISNADFVNGHTLSVAYGYEIYESCQEKGVDDVFVQADQNMYACKQKIKSGKQKQS